MEKALREHRHNHPLYEATSISAKLIDEEQGRAAFVLREQIDIDRSTLASRGWLGDQFRYSVWYVSGDGNAQQLYEDHAYLGGGMQKGRDASINLVGLEKDGVIAEISPKEAEGVVYSKLKVKIALDGELQEPQGFEEQTKNLITRIAPRLGCDYLGAVMRLKGFEVGAACFTTENGSTYGYDTLYLVWKDRNGTLQHQTLMDTRLTKDYINLQSIDMKDGTVTVKTGSGSFTRRLEDLVE